MNRESLGYSSQRVLDYCQQIHRESPGYSSQRVLDYCSVDSQGAAGLFFSMGSRQLSSRFTGSRWVILLNGFQTVVQQIFTGSRCVILLNGSILLSRRFTGNPSVILLNGFQTIIKQNHRESLGYSARRVQDYCPVDSQGVAGLFFSTGSRQLSSRFRGSRWVILPNGFQTIVQQIFTGSRCVILLNGFQTIVKQRFTGSHWVILLNGSQTIVQQIHREPMGYFSQWVQDNCPVDEQGVAGLFFSTGCRLLSSRYPQ